MFRLFCLLSLLSVCSTPCFAVWARHDVVTAETEGVQLPFRLKLSDAEPGKVELYFPLTKQARKDHKGYFLIIAKKALPADQLEFRSEMLAWDSLSKLRNMEGYEQLAPELKAGSHGKLALLEEVRPLPVQKKDGAYEIFLMLDLEVARRSYIVYDFKPWGGGMVLDGGLWLTYDLPSFVDALEKDVPEHERKETDQP